MFLLLGDGDDDECFNVICYSCLVMLVMLAYMIMCNAYLHELTVYSTAVGLVSVYHSLLLRRTMSMLIDGFND